jgi:alanine dehydrogenase
MIVFLSESDVEAAIGIAETVQIVEDAFAASARGLVTVLPRVSQMLPGTAGAFRMLAAALPEQNFFGLKTLTGLPGKRLAKETYFTVLLFDMTSGALRAIISSNHLTGLRTGAASGVAAKYLAREDADSLGVVGTGVQAWYQVEALCAVRNVKTIKVFSRNEERAKAFATKVLQKLGIDAQVAESAREAVKGSALVVAATTSGTPVIEGAWLEPGMHISAVGANTRTKSELDIACFERSIVVADSREQVLEETGDLRAAVESGRVRPDVVVAELSELTAGLKPGRTSPEQITIFKSVGVALQDVAVASCLFVNAERDGIGLRLDAEALSQQFVGVR